MAAFGCVAQSQLKWLAPPLELHLLQFLDEELAVEPAFGHRHRFY